jgi:hypothetical protein
MVFIGSRIRRRLAHDSYLTDGANLIRIVSLADTGSSQLAWIEDCLTLERWAVSGKELQTEGWRSVRPTRAKRGRRTLAHRTQTARPEFFIDSRAQESRL